MAWSAVLLPAPFGPIRPTMRPSSMRRSTLSRAMVDPKALRSPRASMHAMASTLLLWVDGSQQFLWCQAEPLNGGVDPGPGLRQKLLALGAEQEAAGAGFDVHAEASPLLHELLVDQLLVGLEDRDRI